MARRRLDLRALGRASTARRCRWSAATRERFAGFRLPAWAAWLVTFNVVCVAWVFFRAPEPRHRVRHPGRPRAVGPVAARDAAAGAARGRRRWRSRPLPTGLVARGRGVARRSAGGDAGPGRGRAHRGGRRGGRTAGRGPVHLLPVLSRGARARQRPHDAGRPGARRDRDRARRSRPCSTRRRWCARARACSRAPRATSCCRSAARSTTWPARSGCTCRATGSTSRSGRRTRPPRAPSSRRGSTAILRATARRGAGLRPADPARPLHVLVTGDSQAEFLGQRLIDQSPPGLLEVETVARNGDRPHEPGVLQLGDQRASRRWRTRDPDAVVMAIGGNDGFNVQTRRRLAVQPGRPGLGDRVRAPRGGGELGAVGRREAAGVLGAPADRARPRVQRRSSPPRTGPWSGPPRRCRRCATWTSTPRSTTAVTATRLKIDGRRVLARQPDGIHFTRDGAVPAVRLILDAMAEDFPALRGR